MTLRAWPLRRGGPLTPSLSPGGGEGGRPTRDQAPAWSRTCLHSSRCVPLPTLGTLAGYAGGAKSSAPSWGCGRGCPEGPKARLIPAWDAAERSPRSSPPQVSALYGRRIVRLLVVRRVFGRALVLAARALCSAGRESRSFQGRGVSKRELGNEGKSSVWFASTHQIALR